MSMTLLWGAAAVVFFIIEALTISLAGIWFAIGAVCALITALLGAPVWLQIVWFVLISVILLIATRPLAKKYVNGRRQPTNADRLLGQNVRVTERIDNIDGTGAVFADGKTWTARSEDGSIIEAESLVTVRRIEGVKLIVASGEIKQET